MEETFEEYLQRNALLDLKRKVAELEERVDKLEQQRISQFKMRCGKI